VSILGLFCSLYLEKIRGRTVRQVHSKGRKFCSFHRAQVSKFLFRKSNQNIFYRPTSSPALETVLRIRNLLFLVADHLTKVSI
jgi:hypothetical protein